MSEEISISKRGELGLVVSTIPEISVCLIKIEGQIDLFSYGKLKEVFKKWKDEGEEVNLMIDMENARYVASAGWAVMFNAAADAAEKDGAAVVYNMNERVSSSIRHLTARRGNLAMVKTEQEARHLLRTRKRPETINPPTA